MSENINSNRRCDERKSTTSKPRVTSTSDYHRILEEEFARRKTFSGCKTDTRLKEIPTLKAQNQEKLDLSHNLIRRIENVESMKRLRHLNLSHNRIGTVEGIFTLRKLEQLNLSHNCISELPKDFRQLTQLTVLQLHNNKLAQLNSLDNISCLRLARLTLENNFVCKVPGFRKYVHVHFKWLETLDRKPYSHRSLEGNNNAYETPIESMNEQHNNDQLRTCQRERHAQVLEQHRDHNTTQRREAKEEPPATKPEATEIKLVKAERVSKDSEIMSYRQYVQKQQQSLMGDTNFLNEQRKLAEGRAKISQLLSQHRSAITDLLQNYSSTIDEFREARSMDEEVLSRMRDSKSGSSKLQGKFLEMVNIMEDLFESERDNVANLKECVSSSEDGSPKGRASRLARALKLRQDSHDQVAGRLTKAINLANMELINIENQQFLDGHANSSKQSAECKLKIREYSKVHNKAQKLRQNLSAQWRNYCSTAERLLQIWEMAGSGSQQGSPVRLSPPTYDPKEDSSGLKKILFSDRVEQSGSLTNNEEEVRQLQQRLNSQSEKCRNLQEELTLMSKAQELLKRQREEELDERLQCQQMLEQQVAQLTSEKLVYREKWENVELFHSQNSRVYQQLVEKQAQVMALMKQKLSGDFFQQIILNQAQTIESLLQVNKELQSRYTIELKREITSSRFENTMRAKTTKERGCSKTQNTRYPDSNYVTGVEVSDSNLLEYSQERMDNKPKDKISNRNLVSQFNIHDNDSVMIRESAKFKESLSFHNLSRDRPFNATGPPDYFRKSGAFSFKKSAKNLHSGTKHPHNLTTEHNESEGKVTIQHHHTEANNKENEHPNYKYRTLGEEPIDRRSKPYEPGPKQQTENYKNYLKYYLRNNIIEVLSKGDVHPHLKSRWTKEEIVHRKYHSFAGPRLLSNGDKSTRSMQKVLRC